MQALLLRSACTEIWWFGEAIAIEYRLWGAEKILLFKVVKKIRVFEPKAS